VVVGHVPVLIYHALKKNWKHVKQRAIKTVVYFVFIGVVACVALYMDFNQKRELDSLARAVMAYKTDVGNYPTNLKVLLPAYTTCLPEGINEKLNSITYDYTGEGSDTGAPYPPILTFPSSFTMFCSYLYRFEEQKWVRRCM